MNACYPKLIRLLFCLAAVAILVASAGRAQGQKIDLNGNGMSDIWEQLYGAVGVYPNADPDGDGVPNNLEALAGTDPFDPNSVPKITVGAYAGNRFSVSIPSQLGKQYQLQSVQPLGPGGWSNWTVEATMVSRTGTVATLSATVGPDVKFFRIAVSDVDSDGDGVNDWEEYQIGTDPMNPTSNGQLDINGQPMTDYTYATGKLGQQNVVTISASDPIATEPDAGQLPLNVGAITITRGGFPLRSITVNLALAGPGPGIAVEGVDHAVLPRSVSFPAGVSSQTIAVTPLANTNRMTSVVATMKLLAGSGYTMGVASNASVVIYPSTTPTGTGLTGQYYTNASTTYSSSANFNPANLVMTRTDPTVNFVWGTSTTPIPNSGGYYCVRWIGQVEPQYSETYYFDANTDDGVRVWVNDQLIIDSWVLRSPSDSIGTIALQGGVRYDIKMDYFQWTGGASATLSWYSASQSKQVIPSNRLYPSTTTPAPTSVISPLVAYAFLGQPFSFSVMGANLASAFTAQGLPPGLSFNPATGLISGTPNLAGDFSVSVTASNSVGLSASELDLQVIDTGSSVVREIWTNVPGTNIADIPVNSPANLTGTLGTLEGITSYGTNYAERIRGFITAPTTANYYFWLAGSDSAELWIANDSEPVNKVKRAYVTPGGTASRQWNVQPKQRSGWLTLVAGQKYYVEILHKAGTATGDNWAVGWLQDPTGTNTTPSGVVPGFVLSRYYPLPPSYVPGTLYSANMLAEAGAVSTGVGSATLRVSTDGTQAILKFNYSGLTSAETAEHIHSDAYLSNPSQIIFDIDATPRQPDGSYIWNIAPVGTLSAADINEIIREGKAYINIHTINYPGGEINGHFTTAVGSQTFTPPPPAPAWTDDHSSSNAAARFLIQATFGPSPTEVSNVMAMGYDAWIGNQFTLPVSHHLPIVLSKANPDPTQPTYGGTTVFNTWWQQSVSAPDQLRQRVAFALSEIMVVSDAGVLQDNGQALSSYYDTLLDNSFGNFRALLKAVTLTPAMGIYLDMRGNDMGSLITGIHANENYAREIMQLFSIGLNRFWPDGTLVMNSQSELVPTYDQNVIMGFASTFTGWNYHQPNGSNGRLPTNFSPASDYIDPMVLVPTHHELGSKRVLDNVVLPPAQGSQADSTSTNFDNYCSQDLEQALDSIFYNQNVGPFICRELIQRLVTSNPSRDYLYRVVQAFNDNGSGVRGDMQAVIRTILEDYEARCSNVIPQPTFGKQREPLLRVTAAARAFPPVQGLTGTYSQNGDKPITISTSSAHRLNSGDTIMVSFVDTSGNVPPASQSYNVQNTPSTTSFTVNAPGVSTGTYGVIPNTTISNMVTGTIDNTNVISVTISGHGLNPGNPVYVVFTTGGETNGAYSIVSVPNANTFYLETADNVSRSGNALIPKISSGGFVVVNHTNVTFNTGISHGLNPGDSFFINFTQNGSPLDGTYQVASVPDLSHFTFVVASTNNQSQNGATIYPLAAPPLVRSGNATVNWSTWNMGFTDSGSSAALSQTPLNSPTVFNFFFPSFQFPGLLASAGLTTPEFQLTSDTSVALQMNFTEGPFPPPGAGGNTNGYSSFTGNNGNIVMDLGPYLTPSLTSNAGIPGLIDALNSLLTGGQLSSGAKSAIVNYVANNTTFPYTTPTFSQMRDRVRAVVHLILVSPDYIIQK